MKQYVIKVNRMMKHPDFKETRDLFKKIVKQRNKISDDCIITLSYTYEHEYEWYDCRGLPWAGEQITAVFGIELGLGKKSAYVDSGDESYILWYYDDLND